jgi:membrane associated rhomboid family serine protease/Tfp pilus assembly protein PilF
MANCAQCGRKLPAFSFGKKLCQWCVEYQAIQRGEIVEDKQRVMPAPWVRPQMSVGLTQILFGANIAVFLGMALSGATVMDFSGQELVHWGANFGPFTLSGQWWRLLTYMFLHGGLMHIAFNMWCLWDLGALSESLYGRWTFASVYVLSGIGAGLASVGWNPSVLSVGASGSIFGLAGALIASFYLGEFSLPRVAIAGTLRSLLVFAGFNLFFGSVFQGIDNAAHIGGLVTGLILGAAIARIAPQHDNPGRRAGVLLFVALLVATAAVGVKFWRGVPMGFGQISELEQSNPGQVIAKLQKIVKQRPNYAPAHLALARAYFNQGQSTEAEAEFKRALDLDPQSSEARIDLGVEYLNQKRLTEAKEEFKQALVQDPSDGDAHMAMGLALAAEDNNQAAIEEFKNAERLKTDFPGLYSEMGASYLKLKMYDDALAAYNKEEEKSGDNAGIENGLADAYQAKGMTQQSQEARGKAERMRMKER